MTPLHRLCLAKWLCRRLGRPLKVPVLADRFGYALGARSAIELQPLAQRCTSSWRA